MKYLTFLYFLLSHILLFGQINDAHPSTWISTEVNESSENKNYILKEKASSGNSLNFHQLRGNRFQEADAIVTVADKEITQATIFTVFQPAIADMEQTIWSFEKETTAQMVLTTHRTVNFSSKKYLNYDSKNGGILPQIQSYFQQSDDKLAAIRIGEKSLTPALPIENFYGLIPEVMIFDRILGRTERSRVESYLALKYGIPLSQNIKTNYVNGKGQIIWDAKANRTYPFNQAGLGRDDTYGLYQKQATCSYNSNLLTIGLETIQRTNQENTNVIAQNNFLIWSDNNEELTYEETALDFSRKLKRDWLMTTYGDSMNWNTALHFDMERVENVVDRTMKYWLMIDRSGTGNYPLDAVDLFPANDHNHYYLEAQFSNITWNEDGSGKDIFSIVEAPSFFPWVEATLPSCHSNQSGMLQLKVFGGQAPYTCRLQSKRGVDETRIATVNEIIIFDDLIADDYQLIITDANGLRFDKSFFFENVDAPNIDLNKQYVLPKNGVLTLDETSNSSDNLSYHWTGSNDWESTDAQVTIKETGNYQLSVFQNGCENRHSFTVLPKQQNIFERIELYPNPVGVGEEFAVKVKLTEISALDISITDLSGRMVQQTQFSGDNYYLYKDRIKKQGNYQITFSTPNEMHTILISVH